MGLFSWLTGSGSAEKVVDGVVDGLDAVFYTDEEKAVAHQKILDWKLKWLEATKPSNVARRFLAWGVASLWGFNVLVILAAKGIGAEHYAAFAYDVLDDIVNPPFMIVMGFYFMAHVVRGAKGN